MSGFCSKEHSNLLVSLPVDKILNVDKNAESKLNESTDIDEDKVELFEHKSSSIPRQKLRKFFHKMYLIFKELAIIFFVAITYAALTNDTPKLSKSPAAFPFFPKTSVVTDWYHGELSAAIDKARESDIAFVMFYAAWDADSQATREEFDLAARYMQKEIAFAAVNCWQPGSECRKQYNKAYSWPVLIAYPTHGKGIQYKGPRSAPYIVQFLKSISRPIVRIYNEDEVPDLLAKYDAVVVGCVNLSPGSYDFAVFYNTALRFLEKDPMQEVVFALLTESKDMYCNAEAPSLALHMWNETLLYPNDEWKSNSLLTWILSNLHQVSMWITPMGTKSLALSSYIQPGPALILFTPRNPLDSFVDYYDLLHEIGLEYCNCVDNLHVRLSASFLNSKRKENYRKHSQLLQSCSIKSTLTNVQKFPSVVTYTIPKKWANNSCCLSNSKISEEKCLKCDPMDLLTERIQSECDRFKLDKCKNVLEENFEDKHEACEKEDLKSPQNLIKLWKREKCRIARIARNVHPIRVSGSILQMAANPVTVNGLACKRNGSLTLIALDSLRYYHFAERLGVDLTKSKDKTAAVIINQKLEAHHILHGVVNDETLREFIVNFTNNNLPRAYNSETTLKRATNTRQRTKSGVDVLELNTETFFPIVMQDNKAVIVFYYSKQCSFCSGISYTLLTVAKLCHSINSIQFTRLDGDTNVLPWAFTMDRYPTIILFPSRRKSESRVFPRDIPITIPNLISFMLVNLNPSLKLHLMWTLCNQTKFVDEKRSCIASVRSENLSVINNTLRAWRSADLLTKKKLLHNLQQLRNLNLLFGHSPEDVANIERYLKRLHFAPRENVQTKHLEKDKQIVRDEL